MKARSYSWHFGDRAAGAQVLRQFGVDQMTGSEFEGFVADLMELTGFEVERVGGPGDLGADLVASSSDATMTIQIKRYSDEHQVSRRAVSDAIAAKDHYRAETAAVITNRTFTRDAHEFAKGRCFLIGRGFLGAWVATHASDLTGGRTAEAFDGMTGSEFEAFLADVLRERGFRVEEVGGSGDYGVDLIARKSGRSAAIQAKRHSHPVSRDAVSDAVAGKGYYDCNEAWVVTTAPGFTAGAQTLAESTQARLVDRDLLTEWIHESEVTLPYETVASPNLETPEQLVERLRWATQLSDAEIDQPQLHAGSQGLGMAMSAFFLRRIKGELRFAYRNVPEGTWLGIDLPNHRLVEWEGAHSKARSLGTVVATPLSSGSGFVRIKMTAKLPAGKGVQAGLQTLSGTIEHAFAKEMNVHLWSEPPDQDMLHELATMTEGQ